MDKNKYSKVYDGYITIQENIEKSINKISIPNQEWITGVSNRDNHFWRYINNKAISLLESKKWLLLIYILNNDKLSKTEK